MRSVVFRCMVLASALLLLISAGCSNTGRYVARASKPTPRKQAFSDYTLDNGMRVLVHERKNGGPTAVQLWVGGGSLADPDGKAGLGHFVEHMLFETAKSLSPGRDGTPGKTVEAMGGRIDGQTGRDYSYITIALPDGGWEQAVHILYDMAAGTSFSDDAVEAEKLTVADELAQRSNAPELAALEGMFGTAYEKHPYGRPVAGTPETVMAITPTDARALFEGVYVPSNMTLVVSGEVKALRVLTVAKKTFGGIPYAVQKFPIFVDEPNQIAPRELRIERDTRLTYMVMGWHICGASEKDIYALDVLRAMLGLGRGSVLSKNIKERRRLAVDIGAELFATREPGMFAITASLRDEDVKRATEEILKELNGIKRGPVDESALRGAVRAMESAYTLETKDAEGQAFALGYWATVYGYGQQSDYMDIISDVTPEDIQRAAQKYIGEGNYTRVIVGPAHDEE